MDDSDDYFDDGLVLDENDLALLQQEEDKYALNVSQLPDPNPPLAAKPQKTVNLSTSKAQYTTVRSAHTSELDDPPEIFLREDGSYGVRGEAASNSRILAAGLLSEDRNINTQSSISGRSEPKAWPPKEVPLDKTRTPGATKPLLGPTPLSKAQVGSSRPLARNAFENPAHDSLMNTSSANLTTGRLRTTSGASVAETAESQSELATLRTQLEETKKAHLEAQRLLKEAEDIRYAKEGEVSILRKKLVKEAQEHADNVVKFKANMSTAAATQAQMQKEMKEELERLRTQFVFKQHEVEMSIRKPSWSVQSRRAAQGPPPTPVPIPAAMRTWGSRNGVAGSSNLVNETPTRRSVIPETRTKTSRSAKKQRVIFEPAFPGFENSFLPSSPGKSPTARSRKAVDRDKGGGHLPQPSTEFRRKGKEKGKELPMYEHVTHIPIGGPALPSIGRAFERSPRKEDLSSDIEMNDVRSSSPIGDLCDTSFGVDTEMMAELDAEPPTEYDDFVGVNWKDELHRLLFSHSSRTSATLTLHTILSTSLPPTVSPALESMYQTACAMMLESVAAQDSCSDGDEFTFAVATALVKLAQVFAIAKSLMPLLAILHLLTSLSLFIPSFTAALLKTDTLNNDSSPSPMLMTLCDVIREQVKVSKDVDTSADHKSSSDLAEAIMTLLDAICWTIPEDLVEKLAIFARRDAVLMTLLDAHQPPAIIAHTIRSLVLLASHSTLFRSLLSFPYPDVPLEPEPPKDYSRIPLIERLCSFLVDSTPLINEAEDALSSTLNIFALLSNAHHESITILLESNTLIPSLVHYLSQLTTSLWEDDEKLMLSATAASTAVHIINQALHLLHHLVFSPNSVYDLRHKLYHASHRHFNGLTQMFIVMIGRLSYADSPDWLAAESKTEIEQLSEPARDLMDLLVEGPEGDSIWAAYQGVDEQDGIVEEDDEEMEARHLDANEIE